MFATWRDAGVWVKRARIEIVTHGGLLIEKNIGLLSLDLLSLFQKSLGNNHLFHAITADYVDCLCRSAAITAFRTDVFACAAGLFCSAPAPLGKCAENIQQGNTLDHLQILPALLLDKIQQVNSGAGNCPTIFGVMFDFQPMRLGHCLKSFVVIYTVVAGVFDGFGGAVRVKDF